MKRAVVIVTYETDIPQDMDISSLQKDIQKTIKDRLDGFAAISDNYNDDQIQPVFTFDRVEVCSKCTIRIIR